MTWCATISLFRVNGNSACFRVVPLVRPAVNSPRYDEPFAYIKMRHGTRPALLWSASEIEHHNSAPLMRKRRRRRRPRRRQRVKSGDWALRDFHPDALIKSLACKSAHTGRGFLTSARQSAHSLPCSGSQTSATYITITQIWSLHFGNVRQALLESYQLFSLTFAISITFKL